MPAAAPPMMKGGRERERESEERGLETGITGLTVVGAPRAAPAAKTGRALDEKSSLDWAIFS